MVMNHTKEMPHHVIGASQQHWLATTVSRDQDGWLFAERPTYRGQSGLTLVGWFWPTKTVPCGRAHNILGQCCSQCLNMWLFPNNVWQCLMTTTNQGARSESREPGPAVSCDYIANVYRIVVQCWWMFDRVDWVSSTTLNVGLLTKVG